MLFARSVNIEGLEDAVRLTHNRHPQVGVQALEWVPDFHYEATIIVGKFSIEENIRIRPVLIRADQNLDVSRLPASDCEPKDRVGPHSHHDSCFSRAIGGISRRRGSV